MSAAQVKGLDRYFSTRGARSTCVYLLEVDREADSYFVYYQVSVSSQPVKTWFQWEPDHFQSTG
jgi:hypothetical protein